MKHIFLTFLFICFVQMSFAQAEPAKTIDDRIPVRGLAIPVPSVQGLDAFLQFIEKDLAPAQFNMLILRVDWNYAYENHPELRNPNPLTKSDAKKILSVCRKHNIKVVPEVNLLGHQSWAKNTFKLLSVYPEFDETPHVKTENYTEFPNPDGLYCKSYCPLHPDVHKVVFALVDELMDAFEADYFHAGMDEVFYIGDDNCPRCGGRDKAELFAGELTKIQNHLSQKNRRLMIWGDRLIDGKTTGIGMWEASMNQTYRAIDLIPKEVFICDWHYKRADLTNVYFAMKGFDVASCSWNTPEAAAQQIKDMVDFRQRSVPVMGNRFQGLIQTVWAGADRFLPVYYDPETDKVQEKENPLASNARTLKRVMQEFVKLK
ncbi:family 20 glycosylhydrolase [Bacteroides sp. 51]|uniref:family 20 glycosylhydrolase n=1 Tax=Bacteroides sp. 51 TaxID=2302938 RepID=UPI0013D43A53|nr:family 20 glycosylhydrolase [Bacteroides sp. 51]NDV82490.1 glycoside hydrolase [Bacteroides sp. 51]